MWAFAAHWTGLTVGALWFAHAGFDRLLGYGLKSPEGFSFTHLGQIGKPIGAVQARIAETAKPCRNAMRYFPRTLR
jgi:hypothetical protein